MARQNLGVFQHHDGTSQALCRTTSLKRSKPFVSYSFSRLLPFFLGITGTAKDHVVVDYGKRMLSGLQASERIMAMAIQDVLAPDDAGLEVCLVLAWVFVVTIVIFCVCLFVYKQSIAQIKVEPLETRQMQDALPTNKVLQLSSGAW